MKKSTLTWLVCLLGVAACRESRLTGTLAIPESDTHIPSKAEVASTKAQAPRRGQSGFGQAVLRHREGRLTEKELLELDQKYRERGAVRRGRRPEVEIFPAEVTAPMSTIWEAKAWIMNNEDSSILVEKGQLTCGCLDIKGGEGDLAAFESREVRITVAPVADRKDESAVFPFIWHGRRWELKVRIVRR